MPMVLRWLWYLLPGNPLIVRIVQNGSRRSRHLWVRMIYLGLLIGLMLSTLLMGGGASNTSVSLTDLAKAGTNVFLLVAYGQVILICLLAPLFMAAAIAAEQSGKTMDILLTTPLSNLQIVLGSLVGRLFFVLALLASGLPLFSVLLFFGGVPISSVFIAFAVAALTALAVGSVAVWLAVLRKGGRKAVFLFIIAITAYLSLLWGVDRIARFNQTQFTGITVIRTSPAPINASGPPRVMRSSNASTTRPSTGPATRPASQPPAIVLGGGRTTLFTPLHPLLVLEASLNSVNYRPPTFEELAHLPWPVRFYLGNPLGMFAVLCGGQSLLLLIWGAIRLRDVGEAIPLRVRLMRWLKRSRAGESRTRAARSVWHNPIAWRESQTRGSHLGNRLARTGFVTLGLTAAALLLLAYHLDRLPRLTDPFGGGLLSPQAVFQYAFSTLLLVELAIIVLVALYMSASAVSREREDGTLDLILTTPITPRSYLWGKLRGLVRFLSHLLVLPVATVLMMSIYVIVGLRNQWPQVMSSYSILVPTNASGTTTGRVELEIMPPEAAIWTPLVLLPFVALCVMVGMTWSIKSKGVLGSIVPSVAIIGTLALVTGFCGHGLAGQVPWLGPAFNAFSPATSLIMLTNPYEHVAGYVESPTASRISLGVAAVIACAGYSLIVYLLMSAMVHSFDQTVRKLSGAAS